MVVGVDTGGTFTDLVLVDGSGIRVVKVPSTPQDPSLAVEQGLRRLDLAPGFAVVHGTTVATNALLERKGARTALITTEGCRDVLEIGRQTRDQLYSLSPPPRVPLIPRPLRLEVPERLDWRGSVVTPLDTAAVDAALDHLQVEGVESLAVCFLFSFLRPEHELEVGRRARNRGFHVSLSCEVAPELREFERTATVCANACVAPVMARYVERLNERVKGKGGARLSVMQSNGGTLRVSEAAGVAIRTALSGPAGGLVAAMNIARRAGIRRIITFDMGGTSTDVALVEGEPATVRTGEVAGIPLLTPMLDIHTVGAGGGSIARVDAGGALRVGPESAGADPGPVAYGRGERLTVTDANVLLGRLPQGVLLAGTMPLDTERVRWHMERFARQLGCSPEQAALGIIDVVNAQMSRALRHISIERGRDPEGCTLVTFGGAGGLHACALAESLGMGQILVPRFPGAFSALGLAVAPARREYARSVFCPVEESAGGQVAAVLEALGTQARDEMMQEGVSESRVTMAAYVEARYVGQSYSLRVPYRTDPLAIARSFRRAHLSRYGHADPAEPIEITAVGVSAESRTRQRIPDPAFPPADGSAVDTTILVAAGGRHETPVYRRADLAADQSVPGPALVVQDDATTLIAPGWTGRVDGGGNLLLTRLSV